MRKYMLIAAMVLVSATAQAGQGRSLSLASNDEPAATEQPKAAESAKPVEAAKPVDAAAPADAPKYVERPAAVEPAVPAPVTDQGKPVADKGAQPAKAEKPKHKRESTEARVIYELHRHGIYW
jgi:hypothetical protein